MLTPLSPHEWFWQLQAEGRGPDWRLLAVFASGDAPALAAAVQQALPAGFVRATRTGALCALHREAHSHDSYLDPRSAESLAEVRPRNLWVYHAIEVCGHELGVERGYGGYPGGPEGRAETGLLMALATAPELSLREWQIVAGGDGYPVEIVAAGVGAAALLAYLTFASPVSVA